MVNMPIDSKEKKIEIIKEKLIQATAKMSKLKGFVDRLLTEMNDHHLDSKKLTGILMNIERMNSESDPEKKQEYLFRCFDPLLSDTINRRVDFYKNVAFRDLIEEIDASLLKINSYANRQPLRKNLEKILAKIQDNRTSMSRIEGDKSPEGKRIGEIEEGLMKLWDKGTFMRLQDDNITYFQNFFETAFDEIR